MALADLQLIEQQIGQLDQEMASLLREHQDAVRWLAEVPGLACLIHETESASLCGRFFAANEVHDGRNNVRAGAERRLGEGDGVFGTRLRRDGLR